MATSSFRPGSLGHSLSLQDHLGASDNDTDAKGLSPENLPSMLYQAAEDVRGLCVKSSKKKKELVDAACYFLQTQVDPTYAAHYFLPDGAYVTYPGDGRENTEEIANSPGGESSESSGIEDVVEKLRAWAGHLPKPLIDNHQLRQNLSKAADDIIEKVWEVLPEATCLRDPILTPSTSLRASNCAGEEEASTLFIPEHQRHTSTYSVDKKSPIVHQGLNTSLKRKISALSTTSSGACSMEQRGRRHSPVLAFTSPSSSPSAPPPDPEASPEPPREPSPDRIKTSVAYADIHKYGNGSVANILDIVLNTPSFAAKGLLPLAISGSFGKGMGLWGKARVQPGAPEETSWCTEIQRRDDPWQSWTMIARITYDPLELDLSLDEYFDFHFSFKGEDSRWGIRRSTGTWDGQFPSKIMLVEDWGVTHWVKPWDPNLFVDNITKPTRLPPGQGMQCRKAKCHSDNETPVEREYLSPLDPRYDSRFGPDKDYGHGGARFPYFGGGGGGDDDGGDGDDARGQRDNGDDNDSYDDHEKRLKIEKLLADCNANAEARKAELEKRKTKGKGKTNIGKQ